MCRVDSESIPHCLYDKSQVHSFDNVMRCDEGLLYIPIHGNFYFRLTVSRFPDDERRKVEVELCIANNLLFAKPQEAKQKATFPGFLLPRMQPSVLNDVDTRFFFFFDHSMESINEIVNFNVFVDAGKGENLAISITPSYKSSVVGREISFAFPQTSDSMYWAIVSLGSPSRVIALNNTDFMFWYPFFLPESGTSVSSSADLMKETKLRPLSIITLYTNLGLTHNHVVLDGSNITFVVTLPNLEFTRLGLEAGEEDGSPNSSISIVSSPWNQSCEQVWIIPIIFIIFIVF